jgi:hypothetical protein
LFLRIWDKVKIMIQHRPLRTPRNTLLFLPKESIIFQTKRRMVPTVLWLAPPHQAPQCERGYAAAIIRFRPSSVYRPVGAGAREWRTDTRTTVSHKIQSRLAVHPMSNLKNCVCTNRLEFGSSFILVDNVLRHRVTFGFFSHPIPKL